MDTTPQGLGPQPGEDDDATYLENLGYTPQLSRVLGGFASFAIQYSAIAMVGGLVAVFALGLGEVGPSLLWVWIGAGLLQLIIAVATAEACSAYPLAGAAYNIVSRLSGASLGWNVGWMLEMAHIVSVTASSVAIAPVVAGWFGVGHLSHWGMIAVVGILILLSTLVNLFGVRIAAVFNNLGVAAELFATALLIGGVGGVMLFGHHHVNSAGSLFTTDHQVHGSILLPLFFASLVSLYVINAFDVSGTAGEETKDARRKVPMGMLYANVGAFVLGGIMLLLLFLAVHNVNGTLSATQPVTEILNPYLGHPLAQTFEILAVISLWVNNFILQLAGARVMWAQARDGELPGSKFLAKVDRYHVPVNALLVCAAISFLLSLWSSLLVVLVALTAALWQLGYTVLVGSVWVAKLRGQMAQAAIRVPGWRWLYPLAVAWGLFAVGVMVYQDPKQIGLGGLAIIVVGLVIYYVVMPRRKPTPHLVTATVSQEPERHVPQH